MGRLKLTLRAWVFFASVMTAVSASGSSVEEDEEAESMTRCLTGLGRDGEVSVIEAAR